MLFLSFGNVHVYKGGVAGLGLFLERLVRFLLSETLPERVDGKLDKFLSKKWT